MKYKGYLTTDHVLLTSKKIEGLSYEEEREINFDKLLSINYPFQDLKNKIRSCKEKKNKFRTKWTLIQTEQTTFN